MTQTHTQTHNSYAISVCFHYRASRSELSLVVLADPQNAVKSFQPREKGPFTDSRGAERRLGSEGVMGVERIIQINRVVISPTPVCCCYC